MIKIIKTKFLSDILQGLLLGFASLIITIIIEKIEKNIFFPLFISTSIILMVFKNVTISLSSFFPGFIYFLFNFNFGSLSYLLSGMCFFTLILISIIKNNLRIKKQLIVIYLLLIKMFLFSFLFSSFYLTNYKYMHSLLKASIHYWFIMFGCFFMNAIIKFSISIQILYESSNFSFASFYRSSIALNVINNFLKEKKVKYGALIVFRLFYNKKYVDDQPNANDIDPKQVVGKLMEKKLKENSIKFSWIDGIHGFFIPMDNIEKNKKQKINNYYLKKIKEIVNEGNKKFVFDSNKPFLNIDIKAGVSIYGVDSQSIFKLIDYACFALDNQPIFNKNIAFFDYYYYIKAIKESDQFNEMDMKLNLDDYTNSKYLMIDKNQNLFCVMSKIENISEYKYHNNADDIVFQSNWQDLFNRYFAANLLNNVKNIPIAFDYSPTIFENKLFDINNFKIFIERNNIETKNLILIFKKRGIDRIKNFQIVKKNIDLLLQLGIRFIIEINSNPIKVKKIINNVEYVISNFENLQSKSNNFPNSILIVYDINNKPNEKIARSRNVQIINNYQNTKKVDFKKYNKKSKIIM